MAEAAAPGREHTLAGHSDIRRRRSVPPVPLPRQVTTAELLERVAALPSREGKRKPRSDYSDNLARFYNALWRHAHARGTARFRLTWAQLLKANGYEPITYSRAHTSMLNYSRHLEEAGLVRITGRDELADGRTCVVTLLDPPELIESPERRRSSAGQPTSAAGCRAVRRPEKRSQTVAWRVRPWCPKGGRGRAVQRWLFSWSGDVATQGLPFPYGEQQTSERRACTRGAEIDAEKPPGGLAASGRRQDDSRSDRRVDAAPSLSRGSELEALTALAGEGGLESLRQAAVRGADPIAIGIVAWELLFEGPPALTRKRRVQLERACRSIERTQGRPGALHLLGLMEQARREAWLFEQAHPTMPPPQTLNFFVAQVRRDARYWRRRWRAKRAETAARSAREAPNG